MTTRQEILNDRSGSGPFDTQHRPTQDELRNKPRSLDQDSSSRGNQRQDETAAISAGTLKPISQPDSKAWTDNKGVGMKAPQQVDANAIQPIPQDGEPSDQFGDEFVGDTVIQPISPLDKSRG